MLGLRCSLGLLLPRSRLGRFSTSLPWDLMTHSSVCISRHRRSRCREFLGSRNGQMDQQTNHLPNNGEGTHTDKIVVFKFTLKAL